jgi:hypothetical protein
VRSIQRLPTLPDYDAAFISNEYIRWLSKFFRGMIRITREPDARHIAVFLALLPWPMLVLQPTDDPVDFERSKFHIVGGALSKTSSTGWLEFRQVAGRRFTLAAIHDFVPSLPWLIYVLTQAPLHAVVMRKFGEHLGRLGSARG